MRISYKFPLLVLFLLSITAKQASAQEKLAEARNRYSVSYKFGIAADKSTKNMAKNSNTIEISRSFALNQLLSISPILSYSKLGSANAIKDNVISLGADASLYPKYLATLITGDTYEANTDKLFITIGLQKTLNKSDHNLVFKTDLNLFHFYLGNRVVISPNVGYQHFIASKNGFGDLGFYTLGANIRF